MAIAGLLLTLTPWLATIVIGVAGLTAGFFIVHGLASGWVAARAHLVGASASQAAAFYLCAYYAGSSVFGNLGSTAWDAAGWPAVSSLALLLLLAAAWPARTLRRTPALAPRCGTEQRDRRTDQVKANSIAPAGIGGPPRVAPTASTMQTLQ